MLTTLQSARKAAQHWARTTRPASVWLADRAPDHNAAFDYGPGRTLREGGTVHLIPSYGVLTAVSRRDEPFVSCLIATMQGHAFGCACRALPLDSVSDIYIHYTTPRLLQIDCHTPCRNFTAYMAVKEIEHCEAVQIPLSLFVLARLYLAADIIDTSGRYRQHNALDTWVASAPHDLESEELVCTALATSPVFHRIALGGPYLTRIS